VIGKQIRRFPLLGTLRVADASSVLMGLGRVRQVRPAGRVRYRSHQPYQPYLSYPP
jgi:hypothetical protein